MNLRDIIQNALNKQGSNQGVNPMVDLAGISSQPAPINMRENLITKSTPLIQALKMLGYVGNGQPRNPQISSIYEKYKQGQQLTEEEKNLINSQAGKEAFSMVSGMTGGIKSTHPLDEAYMVMRRSIEQLPEEELYRQVGIRKPTWEEFRKMNMRQREAIGEIMAKMEGTYQAPVKKTSPYDLLTK